MNSMLTLNLSVAKPFSLKWRFSLKKAWLTVILATFVLLFLYVLQVNEFTRSSFTLSNYEKNMVELSQESKALEVHFSGLSSLPSVENLITALNYEQVDKVHYIQMMSGTALAK